jgi:hypothetical protein
MPPSVCWAGAAEDALKNTEMLERVTEVAVLISLLTWH